MHPKEQLDITQVDLTLGKSDDLFFAFDTEQLAFTYVNDAFEAITKRKSAELFNRADKLFEIIHPEDRTYVQDSLKSWLSKTTPSVLEFRIRRPDQTERWIRLKAYPTVEAETVKSIWGIAEDDTARKVSMLSLQQINGWKNANLGIIAHDLCGPIGIVQMLASVIGKKLPDNPEIHKLTQLIDDISRRNIDLIQSLVSTEVATAASVEINKERLDIVWEVQQALEVYTQSEDQLNKKMAYTSSHEHIYASIDGLKFMQILHALLSNALMVTPDQGTIRIHLEKLEDRFLLRVADQGPGIPKKKQPILFRKSIPEGDSTIGATESEDSSLVVVKKLVDDHSGKIWFETTQDKGTTFYVAIPIGIHA
jgi:two-component system sensor histidine kinase VicK